MIVLWGLPTDNPLRRVAEELDRLKTAFEVFDQGRTLALRPVLEVADGVRGHVEVEGRTLDLASVSGLYARPYDWTQICQALGYRAGSREWAQTAATHETVCAWWSVVAGTVLNPPQAMASNGSKPYQSGLIQAAGLNVPATLVTTDPSAAMQFWERHRAVIYKSVSGVRSHVAQLSAESVRRLDLVSLCPTQFQEYVPGTDVRVHVVGDELFATEIISGATDYRYPSENDGDVELRAVSLPEEMVEACLRVSKALGLSMSGIDLRRTPWGRWVCLEVNPSPGFTYYESATGQPIAAAAARLLAGHPRRGETAADAGQSWPPTTTSDPQTACAPFIRADERPEVGLAPLANIGQPPDLPVQP